MKDVDSLRLALSPDNIDKVLKLVGQMKKDNKDLKKMYPFKNYKKSKQTISVLQFPLDILIDEHNQRRKDSLSVLP